MLFDECGQPAFPDQLPNIRMASAMWSMFMPGVAVMLMRMTIFLAVLVAPFFIVAMMCVLIMMMNMLVLHVRMRGPFVNAKFDSLNPEPLPTLKVHVEISNLNFGKLPFECRWLD